MDPLLGQVINQKFRVLRLLGEGGMGKVYVCEQQGIGRKVALKVLREGLSKIPTVAARFEREAAAAARVIHPNSVTIFDFGRDPNGQLYLAMEYLDGESLAARLKREKRLSAASATAITSQLLETLEACHSAGVIHRDLKPDNIFLCPGPGAEVVKILDYGVARVADAPEVTKTGQLIGTPFYMSPEQATGKKVTQAADLYALGIVLFEMLTGRPPYVEKSHLDLFRKHVSAPIPTLREAAPDREELTYFESIIQKVLAKRPEERFSSAKEMRAALQRASFDLRASKLAAFWEIAPDATESTLLSGDDSFSGKLTLGMDENGDGAPTSVDDSQSVGTLELSRSMASDAKRLGLAKTEVPEATEEVDQTVAMGKIELPGDAPMAFENTQTAAPSPKASPRVVLDNARLKRAESKPDSSKIPVSVRVPIDDPRIQSARLPKAEPPKEPQPYSEPPAEELPFFTAPEQAKLDLSSIQPAQTQAPPKRWPLFASLPILLAALLVFVWPASTNVAEVFIQSSPTGAKILLNQVERSGVTPMRLPLPIGEVTIEAQKEGCAPTKKTLTRDKSLAQIVLVLKCQ